jgi:acyl-CoA synthetase (AMP-forming)/AMP-acid ligase II
LHVLNASSRLNLHVVYMPNFALELCVRQANEGEVGDWSSICCMPSGGEAIQPDAVAAFEDSFASRGLAQGTVQPGYGLAEATLLLTALPLGMPRQVAEIQGARRMANGPLVPGIELAIVNPETQLEMPPGEVGEVWARGADNIGLGYWNRAEETQATFNNTLSGRGTGWLRTGDLGVLQSDQLFITGRIKNLFIFNGVNHHPEDLEAALAGVHPMVPPNGVLAFAAKDPERLVLLVEVGPAFRRFDRWAEPAEGIAEVLNRDWQLVPDEIQFLPFGSIPKTTSGKPRRQAARDLFEAGETRPLHTWLARQVSQDRSEVNALLQELEAITGRAMGLEKLDEPLAKLRLQSIEAAAFAGALSKRFKKKVHPLDLQKYATLSELLEQLSS